MNDLKVSQSQINNLIDYYKEFKFIKDNGYDVSVASLTKKYNLDENINTFLNKFNVISINGVGKYASYKFNGNDLEPKIARDILIDIKGRKSMYNKEYREKRNKVTINNKTKKDQYKDDIIFYHCLNYSYRDIAEKVPVSHTYIAEIINEFKETPKKDFNDMTNKISKRKTSDKIQRKTIRILSFIVIDIEYYYNITDPNPSKQ